MPRFCGFIQWEFECLENNYVNRKTCIVDLGLSRPLVAVGLVRDGSPRLLESSSLPWSLCPSVLVAGRCCGEVSNAQWHLCNRNNHNLLLYYVKYFLLGTNRYKLLHVSYLLIVALSLINLFLADNIWLLIV